MRKYIAPCLFGLETFCKNEFKFMGMQNVKAENGRVRFEGDDNAFMRANIMSRFSERILIELGSFKATSFDALFEGTRKLPFEEFIGKNDGFPVKGFSLNSKLFSVPDCQKIIKKAVSKRLESAYKLRWFPETGSLVRIQFILIDDTVSLCADTSGQGLHKRGYRPENYEAPIRETLAAAMVDISGYKGFGELADPFCGSGTIAIEAAFAAKRRAPGLNRNFISEDWQISEKKAWQEAREYAKSREFKGNYKIYGSDISPKAIELCQKNALRAGVADCVSFEIADALKFERKTEEGRIVTNPPYGLRLMDEKESRELYTAFGKTYSTLENWDAYIISPEPEFESCFGKKAEKTRRLYNGNIRSTLYMYRNKKIR